jgi:hypothetical protein
MVAPTSDSLAQMPKHLRLIVHCMRVNVGCPRTESACRSNTGLAESSLDDENTSIRLARQHKNGNQFCYLLAVSASSRVQASLLPQ